ncbi:MAG: PAM68 family protein [Hormoscilla sp. GUM202]|nr:PAM68 family protein [Hormoscilla sp. GUM202]
MVRRMALLCGIPTALGMLTFGVSYGIYVYTEFKLPNVAVLLTSIGCFGLGILGLSYGFLSASWEEKVPGSLLGWAELCDSFSVNHRCKTRWGTTSRVPLALTTYR